MAPEEETEGCRQWGIQHRTPPQRPRLPRAFREVCVIKQVLPFPLCLLASTTLTADEQPKRSYAENLVDQNVKLLTQWLLLSKVRAELGDINLF